jgi:hypothetical protein
VPAGTRRSGLGTTTGFAIARAVGPDDTLVPAETATPGLAGRLRTGWTSGAAIVLLLLAGALLLGSRHLITRGVPVIGDLAPIDAPGHLFGEWARGWRGTGLGAEAAAPSAFGLLSGLGALLGGHTALLRLLLTVGMIPVGVLGAFRLLRPTGSRRAAAGAAIAYAVLPLPYGALAGGRWAPLAVYAAAPWLLAGLARAGGMAPVGLRPPVRRPDDGGTDDDDRAGEPDTGAAGVDGSLPRRRDEPVLLHALGLGVLTALLAMLVPPAPVVLLVMAAALAVGSVLAFEPKGVGRLARAALGGAVVAFALHLPWSWELLRSWRDSGLWTSVDRSAGSVDPLDVLRRGAGMSGAGTLAWALLPAAAAVLLVGREWRLSWAIRGWVLALVAWAAAWASWHQALGAPWPEPDVLLTLGGLGVALAIGSGVAAVEVDVVSRGRSMGLRRIVAAGGAAAFLVACVPLVKASFDGYWEMPRGDFSASSTTTRPRWRRGCCGSATRTCCRCPAGRWTTAPTTGAWPTPPARGCPRSTTCGPVRSTTPPPASVMPSTSPSGSRPPGWAGCWRRWPCST